MKKYVKIWIQRFPDYMFAPANTIASGVTILAFLGFQVGGSPYKSYFIAALVALILLQVFRSRPRLHKDPSKLLNQRLELAELDTVTAPFKKVALLGVGDSGKSTFLDAAAGLRLMKRQTNQPYARFLSVPDTSPLKYVAFIDTVGQHQRRQHEIMSECDLAVLMLDHNEADNIKTPDEKRIANQLAFVDQIRADIARTAVATKVMILVANKNDLWESRKENREIMKKFISSATEALKKHQANIVVETVDKHSNFRTADVHKLQEILQYKLYR